MEVGGFVPKTDNIGSISVAMLIGDGTGSGWDIVLGCHSVLLEFCLSYRGGGDDNDDFDIGGTFAFQMCIGEDGVCSFVS